MKRLLVKKQGRIIPELTAAVPTSGIISVGSDASATIELAGGAVAPEQFVVVCEGDQLTLLCRVDGTEINGARLPKGSLHNLEPGDTIKVGDYTLTLESAETENETATGAEDRPAAAGPTAPEAAAPETETVSVAAAEEPAAERPASEKEPDRGAFEPDKSLSDVLEGLKAEEKFYFLIENGHEEKRRVYVESEEMWLGWTASGECVISSDPSDVAVPRAQVRKDWSGVVLYPLKSRNVWLNAQALDEPHRLKNDDSLQLSCAEKAQLDPKTNIKFHEPTALLVLDSILPKELPPPVSLDKKARAGAAGGLPEASATGAAAARRPAASASGGTIFGYFTALEIFIMIIGILVAAAMIFLVLEYY